MFLFVGKGGSVSLGGGGLFSFVSFLFPFCFHVFSILNFDFVFCCHFASFNLYFSHFLFFLSPY